MGWLGWALASLLLAGLPWPEKADFQTQIHDICLLDVSHVYLFGKEMSLLRLSC